MLGALYITVRVPEVVLEDDIALVSYGGLSFPRGLCSIGRSRVYFVGDQEERDDYT